MIFHNIRKEINFVLLKYVNVCYNCGNQENKKMEVIDLKCSKYIDEYIELCSLEWEKN